MSLVLHSKGDRTDGPGDKGATVGGGGGSIGNGVPTSLPGARTGVGGGGGVCVGGQLGTSVCLGSVGRCVSDGVDERV